jgi:hypothetical protein
MLLTPMVSKGGIQTPLPPGDAIRGQTKTFIASIDLLGYLL